MQELKKTHRIRDGREYRRVYRHGRYWVRPHVVLYILAMAGPTRAGFVTGKRVGNAVRRNRARRLMREVYRLQRGRLADGYLLVFVGRAGLSELSHAAAEKEILQVLRRAKVLVC